jgi:GT2 family glycosyltransferase
METSIANSSCGNYFDTPLLSVVLATPGRFDNIRNTVHCLLAQSITQRIELIIVTPYSKDLEIDENSVSDFFDYKVIEFPGMNSVGAANAMGIRAATAPVVALCEDHSFPEPGWAEALIKAHAGDFAAVGPVIKNANPKTLVSWADLLVAYAPWLDSTPSGERDHLPGHNSSYKKKVLLSYGSDLEKMMASESVLHWDLRQKGYRLYLEANAKTAHTNFSLFSSWIKSKFHSGRVFGSSRVSGWPSWKRLVFTAASPLIPIVRLRKITSQLRGSRKTFQGFLNVFPVMVAGLIISALGEMAGYAFGPGNSIDILSNYEFHRTRHQCEADHK